MRLKYIIVVGDGMSDDRLEALGWRTPLEVSAHPNMDMIARRGLCGFLKTVPPGFTAGTDVALMSILGYDPVVCHTGRGPLEAAGVGVELGDDDLAFRCNFVTVVDGFLRDHSAGHISTEEAGELLKAVKERFEKKGDVEFYRGVGYRHLLILRGLKYSDRVVCTPPHDALNTPVNQILVRALEDEGKVTSDTLNAMVLVSEGFLSTHPVNVKRVKRGENPGNMIWPWGHGRRPKIRPLKEVYGVKGAVISAVDIVRGIGVLAGMDVVDVPGATGFYDTNYEGKADYALKSLKENDLVLIHIEAPDEASHIGDPGLKVKTIEDIDKRLIGRLLQHLEGDYTIAILPDHKTKTEGGVHLSDPVPFTVYSTRLEGGDGVKHFDEQSVREGSAGVVEGLKFMSLLLVFR